MVVRLLAPLKFWSSTRLPSDEWLDDACRVFWRSSPCTLPVLHYSRRLGRYAAATGPHARVAASGRATPRKPEIPRRSFPCRGRTDLRWTTCGRTFAPSCPQCLRGRRCRGRRSVQMLLPLDLLLPLLLGPLSTATTSGRWPALDTNQPTNQRIGPPLRPVLTPTLAPNPNQDTLLVSLHFGGRTQKVRIAADGSTDALYAAAMQVYALHGQRVALSVRGVPLPEGVPVQQGVGLVLAAARDDAVLVTAAPQLTVQEIYGLPVGDAGSVEGTRDGAKGVGGAGGAEGTRDGAGGAGGGSERGSEQGGRSS
eukprot:scaffold69788_cov54-Phaeocystis_antarctica.AAC.1